MDIQAVSAAATIAVACAIVFLLAARSWQLLSRTFSAHSNFSDSIMSEAAQRLRDELTELSRKQSTYLGAGLVFVVMYVVGAAFNGPTLFEGYPEWQLYGLLALLLAAAAFAAWRLIRTVVAWRQVHYMRDASIAIGHELQRIAASQGRTYHDVPTAFGIIDHVLIGPGGIYAVNVVARRHAKSGTAALVAGELDFSNAKQGIDIAAQATATRRLEKELSKQAGRPLRVRSVIATPGWDIEKQQDPDHLLVNERTLPMLRGWRDPADHLMDEEVQRLQSYLTGRCKRSA
ncbi:MAG: hypothetical protein AAFX10_15095 [Pseudomonadota bacterium]